MAERRPIASRDTAFARSVASWLTRSGVTPNAISQASMVFGAVGGLAFWAGGISGGGAGAALLILGAAACQARLLCNLFDGMVAVEGGRSGPDGAFWNEAPDRVADLFILAGAGAAIGAPALGFAAAAMAILTAYLRELGRAEGAPADFTGPMAKPHRMAAMTLGGVIGAVQLLVTGSMTLFAAMLWMVAVGTALTAIRRSVHLVEWLKANR